MDAADDDDDESEALRFDEDEDDHASLLGLLFIKKVSFVLLSFSFVGDVVPVLCDRDDGAKIFFLGSIDVNENESMHTGVSNNPMNTVFIFSFC